MTSYRCTRNSPYRAPSCPGRVDRSAREGYHLDAQSIPQALDTMAIRFPTDVVEYGSKEAAFTVDPG